MKISLHIELCPTCRQDLAADLQGRLGSIGFTVVYAETGSFECRQDRFTSLKAARAAVAEIVQEVGATVLDSRVQVHGPGKWARSN